LETESVLATLLSMPGYQISVIAVATLCASLCIVVADKLF